jgi:hypothetical protein
MLFSKKRGKSQAAMEFLMTYGWAILLILVALGTMYYLGVFSPQSPDSIISWAAPVFVSDVAITEDSVMVSAKALSGYIANITDMKINKESCEEIDGVLNSPLIMETPTTISCDGLELEEGKKINVELAIQYQSAEGGVYHTETGTFSGEVEGNVNITENYTQPPSNQTFSPFNQTYVPPVLTPKCGDGIQTAGEECDWGELNGFCETSGSPTSGFYQWNSPNQTCDKNCKLVMGCNLTSEVFPVCGNGIYEPKDKEHVLYATNKELTIKGKEECDGADFGGKTCADFGFSSGQLSCQNCRILTNSCNNYAWGSSKVMLLWLNEPTMLDNKVSFTLRYTNREDIPIFDYFIKTSIGTQEKIIDAISYKLETIDSPLLAGWALIKISNPSLSPRELFNLRQGIEPVLSTTSCGDGIVNNGEQCDNTNLTYTREVYTFGSQGIKKEYKTTSNSCYSYGLNEGTITCNNDCTLNFDKCNTTLLGSIDIYDKNELPALIHFSTEGNDVILTKIDANTGMFDIKYGNSAQISPPYGFPSNRFVMYIPKSLLSGIIEPKQSLPPNSIKYASFRNVIYPFE